MRPSLIDASASPDEFELAAKHHHRAVSHEPPLQRLPVRHQLPVGRHLKLHGLPVAIAPPVGPIACIDLVVSVRAHHLKTRALL